jgi:hypothetical protein
MQSVLLRYYGTGLPRSLKGDVVQRSPAKAGQGPPERKPPAQQPPDPPQLATRLPSAAPPRARGRADPSGAGARTRPRAARPAAASSAASAATRPDAAGGAVRRAGHRRSNQPPDPSPFLAAGPAGAGAALRGQRPVRTTTPKGAPMRTTAVRIAALAAVAGALAWLLATAAPALAGTYTVNACQANRFGFSTKAFVDFSTLGNMPTAGVYMRRACAPTDTGPACCAPPGSSAAIRPASCWTRRWTPTSSSSSGPGRPSGATAATRSRCTRWAPTGRY